MNTKSLPKWASDPKELNKAKYLSSETAWACDELDDGLGSWSQTLRRFEYQNQVWVQNALFTTSAPFKPTTRGSLVLETEDIRAQYIPKNEDMCGEFLSLASVKRAAKKVEGTRIAEFRNGSHVSYDYFLPGCRIGDFDRNGDFVEAGNSRVVLVATKMPSGKIVWKQQP